MGVIWEKGDIIPDHDRGRPRWEIHQILRGGMGVVYVVYDHAWHQPFAIKTFQDEVFINNPTVAERFMHEALIWVNLDVHQNVIRARMVQQIVKKPHLFLEYVNGGDLSKWIGTSRLMQDLPQVMRFAIQFCDGMRHALSKGVKAHRDIKPQNCLITQDRTLKVTDFGLAKMFDEAPLAAYGVPVQQPQELNLVLTRSGVVAGTPAYMAPEQFDDPRHVDVRADIYSFGVMLYEMAMGRRPFAGRTWQELERAHRLQPPPALIAQNPELRKVVEVCLAKRPENRYEDFRQVRDELAQVYRQLTGEDAPQAVAGEKLTAAHLLDKGVNLDALGRTEEALACYDRLLKDDSSFALAWINKGVILTESGRAVEAIACFNRALKIAPHYDMAWLKKGRALDKLGRREEAEACYDRALQLNPQYEEALIVKGRALSNSGRREEAIDYYDRLLRIAPNSTGWLNKGAELDALGRFEEAIACCDSAIELERDFELAWLNKGKALSKLKRPEEALACFDRVLQINPRNEDGWISRARELRELGQSDEALACYDRALELNPSHPRAGIFKGRDLEEAGRNDESLTCYDQVVKADPHNQHAWYFKGMLLLTHFQRYGESLACFEEAQRLGYSEAASCIPVCQEGLLLSLKEALRNESKVVQEYLQEGAALAKSQRWAEALACYERTLELSPRHPMVWVDKGEALVALDRVKEAIACYDHALEINQYNGFAWCGKGNVLLKKFGQYQEALTCFEKAQRLGTPVAAQLVDICRQFIAVDYHDRGAKLGRAGHNEDALACFERALEINPRDAGVWSDKGSALGNLGRMEEAVACYDLAIEIDPRLDAAWTGKGLALEQLGRVDEAAACFDRVLELNPHDELAWVDKGRALKGLGRMEEAVDCYNQALKFNPRNALAWMDKAQALAILGSLHEALSCYEEAQRLGHPNAADGIVWCQRKLSS